MGADRIVFSDIDGTFLTPEHQVTVATADAVRQLLARGIPFVLVSARMPEAILPITRALGIDIPLVCYSGALALTAAGEELLSRRMPLPAVREALGIIAEAFPALTVNYYAGHHWYVEARDARVQHEEEITSAAAKVVPFARVLGRAEQPHKLLLMGEEAEIAAAEQALAARLPACNVVRSSPILLEIMSREVTKAAGIEAMLRAFSLTPAQAISFGDNYNDIPMLSYTGEGVAMGNAPEAVRQAASAVTLANTEDGIAAYLKRQGLIR